jgi:hypothetical protein
MDSYKPIILLLAEALALVIVSTKYFFLKGVFCANVKWYKMFRGTMVRSWAAKIAKQNGDSYPLF